MLNDGRGGVVETSVPNSYADSLMRWDNLDGVGPARFVPPEEIPDLNAAMDGIREVP